MPEPTLPGRSSQPPASKRAVKRAPLTEANVKRLEKMTGGSGRKRRREAEDSGSESESESDSESDHERSLYLKELFYMRAYDNGIRLNQVDAKEPANFKFLEERINRHRKSPSPTRSEYDVAVHKLMIPENHSTNAEEVSKLLKDYGIKEYRRATNLSFKHFPKNVGFNNGLEPAQPDLIEGLEVQEFSPYPILDELGGIAMSCIKPHAITLSHFAGILKGQVTKTGISEIEASYIGATLVYGRDAARKALNDPDPVGEAHVVTFTTESGTLQTFACYSEETQGQALYHQFPITHGFLTFDYEAFKKARRQLRNLQDYGREASEALRDELRETWVRKHDEAAKPRAGGEGGAGKEAAGGGGAKGRNGAKGKGPDTCEEGGGGQGAEGGGGTKRRKGAKGKVPGNVAGTAQRRSTRKKGPA